MTTTLYKDGRWIQVPDEQVNEALSAGAQVDSSNLFVRSPSGRIIKTTPERAQLAFDKNMGFRLATDEERALEGAKGPASTARAFAGSAASALSFGLSDIALRAVGGAEKARLEREANPVASTVGEVGAIVASVAVPELWLTKAGAAGEIARGAFALPKAVGAAGRGVSEGVGDWALHALTADGQSAGLAARALAKTVGTAAGGAVEGGIYGVGQAVSEQALGDPQTVGEALVAHVGPAALLGGALGGVFGAAGELGGAAMAKLQETATSRLGKLVTEGEREFRLQAFSKLGISDARKASWIRKRGSTWADDAADFLNNHVAPGDTVPITGHASVLENQQAALKTREELGSYYAKMWGSLDQAAGRAEAGQQAAAKEAFDKSLADFGNLYSDKAGEWFAAPYGKARSDALLDWVEAATGKRGMPVPATDLWEFLSTAPEARQELLQRSPLGRFVNIEERTVIPREPTYAGPARERTRVDWNAQHPELTSPGPEPTVREPSPFVQAKRGLDKFDEDFANAIKRYARGVGPEFKAPAPPEFVPPGKLPKPSARNILDRVKADIVPELQKFPEGASSANRVTNWASELLGKEPLTWKGLNEIQTKLSLEVGGKSAIYGSEQWAKQQLAKIMRQELRSSGADFIKATGGDVAAFERGMKAADRLYSFVADPAREAGVMQHFNKESGLGNILNSPMGKAFVSSVGWHAARGQINPVTVLPRALGFAFARGAINRLGARAGSTAALRDVVLQVQSRLDRAFEALRGAGRGLQRSTTPSASKTLMEITNEDTPQAAARAYVLNNAKLLGNPERLTERVASSIAGMEQDAPNVAAVVGAVAAKAAALQDHIAPKPMLGQSLQPLAALAKWKPTAEQAYKVARVALVLEDPISVIEDMARGKAPAPAEVELLGEVYPSLLQAARERLGALLAPSDKELAPDRARAVKALLGLDPDYAYTQTSQALYVPAPKPQRQAPNIKGVDKPQDNPYYSDAQRLENLG